MAPLCHRVAEQHPSGVPRPLPGASSWRGRPVPRLARGAPMQADDHYIVISADTHAGASHATYRDFLEKRYLDDFDAWRGQYKNPFKDLKDTDLRIRNWDTDRRNHDQEADGVVGEVIFPNTVP